MTSTLHDAYQELAKDAHNYADPAIFTAPDRRRRPRPSLQVIGAAAAVAAIVLTLTLVEVRRDRPGGLAAPASATHIDGLPDTAVGSAALAYTECMNRCPLRLVTTNGQKLVLSAVTVPPQGNVTISPDGRWLGAPTPAGYLLRDLAGTTTITVPSANPREGWVLSPWTWSKDSQHVILGFHADGNVEQYFDVDLNEGSSTPVAVKPGQEVVGVLTSGELITIDTVGYAQSPLTQLQLTSARTKVALQSGPEGAFANGSPAISVRGDRIYVIQYTDRPVAVLVFDLSGTRVERLPISATEVPAAATPDGYILMDVAGGKTFRLTRESKVPVNLPAPINGQAVFIFPGGARH